MLAGVTGGSGFIGRHLVSECLSRGHQVKVLSRKKDCSIQGVDICHGDLTDPNSDFSEFVEDLDVLYHCAGEIYDESLMRSLHVDGTKRLLAAAKDRVGRWVQLSSVGVYGVKRSGIIEESASANPKGVYESTKTESDNAVRKAAESGNMRYAILRPSNVFGIDMPNQSLIGLINMLRKGLFFYVGPPGSVMNYIHVSSVVRALILCGEHENAPGNTYILSEHITVEEMVSALAKGLEIAEPKIRISEGMVRGLTKVLERLPGMPLSTSRIDALTGRAVYSSSKIERDLGFNEEGSLEESFRDFSNNLTRS